MKNKRDELENEIRSIRGRYDELSAGDRAVLRRSKDEDGIMLHGSYWRLVGDSHTGALSTVVMLFPEAPTTRAGREFKFGRFLRNNLRSGEDSANLRVRRVIESSREDLGHRLRGLLRLASGRVHPVDWGVLGADITFFGDNIRRRWTQEFFAPFSKESSELPEEEKEL